MKDTLNSNAMEIVFIKDFNGIKRGTTCDISDHYGNQHIKAGNAVLSANWTGDEETETDKTETQPENVSQETKIKRTKKRNK